MIFFLTISFVALALAVLTYFLVPKDDKFKHPLEYRPSLFMIILFYVGSLLFLISACYKPVLQLFHRKNGK
jgi:hypothetical protein